MRPDRGPVYAYFRLQHSCFERDPDKSQIWDTRRVRRPINHINHARDLLAPLMNLFSTNELHSCASSAPSVITPGLIKHCLQVIL
jgi:hypothetical protein